ncbi:hypothetical protein DFH08DRAFT_295106 [Mycena albidolilacea]|uniref:Uncharacterized protein n=1 Tax=Mycena albidolilacea TaxID=1033008 RepID=A0AAD6ZR45_9AGAR|nr:hypothetical protein DFH08DRAFT_295106 [Mycena albidolilacea]
MARRARWMRSHHYATSTPATRHSISILIWLIYDTTRISGRRRGCGLWKDSPFWAGWRAARDRCEAAITLHRPSTIRLGLDAGGARVSTLLRISRICELQRANRESRRDARWLCSLLRSTQRERHPGFCFWTAWDDVTKSYDSLQISSDGRHRRALLRMDIGPGSCRTPCPARGSSSRLETGQHGSASGAGISTAGLGIPHCCVSGRCAVAHRRAIWIVGAAREESIN